MRNFRQICTLIAAFVLLSAFTHLHPTDICGTFAVPETDQSPVMLTLNPDGSFFYQDLSSKARPIKTHGSWTQKGKRVHLESTDNPPTFHNVWKIESNGQVARSRRGLNFYRLCKVNP